MSGTTVDVIVIGAGPVGENVADRARAGGLTVLVIERGLAGGDCSYWACVPSKALLRPGSALAAARSVEGAREVTGGRPDSGAVLHRRDRKVGNWDDSGQVNWITSTGAMFLRGEASIAGERTVLVDGTKYVARHAVVIASGSDALIPPIAGLETARPWTNRQATEVTAIPQSLAILGAGAVGLEMATIFADLGADVHVIARGGALRRFERFAGDAVVEALRSRGVTVSLGVDVKSVQRRETSVVIETTHGTVEADELLVATGRAPRTRHLGLAALGIDDASWLQTDESLLVKGTNWLYAVGDANGRALLTHQGKYQARAAGAAIVERAAGRTVDVRAWGRHATTADERAVPQVIFTNPQVAAVGLTLEQALRGGLDAVAVDSSFDSVAGAGLHADDYRGAARIVINRDTRTIVGASLVGPDVEGLIGFATLAIVGEVPVDRLWHVVPPFPTTNEIWLRLLEAHGRS